MKPITVLRKVRNLIGDPNHWSSDEMYSSTPDSEKINQYSLPGAISEVVGLSTIAPPTTFPLIDEACDLLRQHLKGTIFEHWHHHTELSAYNNVGTHADVMALLDKAISPEKYTLPLPLPEVVIERARRTGTL